MEQKKKWLFAVILVVLSLPLLQQHFSIIKSGPLNGEFETAPDVSFSLDKWWEGTYAVEKGNYINDNIGLRPDLIRFSNEIDHDLFDKIHSEWRLIGTNSCLFQDVYIYSYLGRDFDGYKVINEKLRKLKAIQDTLGRIGKSLILIQSPCKAFFYPEYLPQKYRDTARGMTNYAAYARLADSMGINQIDFNRWFVDLKKENKELLYPKQGFHWSEYGALIALDSMVSYIEKLRHVTVPHPVWDKIEHTTQARSVDDDIIQSLNLIFPVMKETFSYPIVSYRENGTTKKQGILFSGDSFLFHWIRNGGLYNISDNWQIIYYYRTLIDKDHDERSRTSLDGYDLRKAVDKTDCVVIMYTSRNMSNLGFGFIEELYKLYYPH